MTPEQIIAWLTLEGWTPVDEGEAAFNPRTLMHVRGDGHYFQCRPDGAFASGAYKHDKFSPAHVDALYEVITKEGL